MKEINVRRNKHVSTNLFGSQHKQFAKGAEVRIFIVGIYMKPNRW